MKGSYIMNNEPKDKAVNLKLPRELIALVDSIGKKENRLRANQIRHLLATHPLILQEGGNG
jgi:hypothetical protein